MKSRAYLFFFNAVMKSWLEFSRVYFNNYQLVLTMSLMKRLPHYGYQGMIGCPMALSHFLNQAKHHGWISDLGQKFRLDLWTVNSSRQSNVYIRK